MSITTTSLTARMLLKGSTSRWAPSTWKRRTSTSSWGVTSTWAIPPVCVSTTKFSMTPRIWPSLVITVLPRSSVRNLRMDCPSGMGEERYLIVVGERKPGPAQNLAGPDRARRRRIRAGNPYIGHPGRGHPAPMLRTIRKENPELVHLLVALRKAAKSHDAPLWGDVALRLVRGRHQTMPLNVRQLERLAQPNQTVVVPGKLLAEGRLT